MNKKFTKIVVPTIFAIIIFVIYFYYAWSNPIDVMTYKEWEALILITCCLCSSFVKSTNPKKDAMFNTIFISFIGLNMIFLSICYSAWCLFLVGFDLYCVRYWVGRYKFYKNKVNEPIS